MAIQDRGVMTKLRFWLEENVSLGDIISVNNMASNFKDTCRVVPYCLVDDDDRDVISKTEYGRVLLDWADVTAGLTGKNINRGRRLVRALNGMILKHGFCLPYMFGDIKSFTNLLGVLSLDVESLSDSRLVDLIYAYDGNFKEKIVYVQKYLVAVLLYTGLLDLEDEKLVYSLIITDTSRVVDTIIEGYKNKKYKIRDVGV